MLTPDFKLTQSQEQIIVVMRLPYVKVSACEFYIQANCFKFYLKPYLLSLNFEQCLQQAQQPSKAKYFHDKHLLEVHLKKRTVGEHFQNLNLLSSVLTNKKQEKGKKKNIIEVVGEESSIVNIESESKQKRCMNVYSYGFCHNYSSVFKGLEQECFQLFSFNPEEVAISDRSKLSQQIVESAIDEDAYLFDKYENQDMERIIKSKQMEVCVNKMIEKFKSIQPTSYQEFRSQVKLPNKQLLVEVCQSAHILKQLLNIVFCYLYELICMEGQLSVQSPKTINITSAVLNCCLDFSQSTVEDVILISSKRCLTYSLYKSVPICDKVKNYLISNLTQDLFCVVLNDVRTLFNKYEPRYLLNVIFIDDYLIYCYKSTLSDEIIKIKQQLMKIKIEESKLGFEFQTQSDCESQREQRQVETTKIEEAKLL